MAFSTADFNDSFIAETTEHIDAINNGTITLKKSPENFGVLSSVLRELHTVKGTARMMGFSKIEQLSHGMEDVFKGVREKKYNINDNIVQLTFAVSDCIKKALKKIKKSGKDDIDISAYVEVFKRAEKGEKFSLDDLEPKKRKSSAAKKTESDDFDDEQSDSLENITSIRIDLSRINEMIRAFDNLIIRQFRFKTQLDEFEARLSKSENNITELPKQLKEDLLLTENAIFDTQHQLLNLRMLPLGMVLNPLKKEIELDAMKLSKNIDFDIPITDFMLDKAILEKLKEILLHLVRNSIDHGIESVQERKKLKKNPRGKISIHSQQISNHIIISVSDDGRGIDYEKIRAKAISLYPEQKKDIEKMSDKELQQFIFMSGFSTNENPTALSGRGVGLDVVRSHTDKIKGRVHIKTVKNEGTTFELTIPLSLATQQGLFVHVSQMKLMIPSHCIVEVLDCDPKTFTTFQGQTYVVLHGRLLPVHYLSSILGTSKKEDAHSLIVAEYLESQIGIVVDSIAQYENVVVNPLPKLMEKMEAVQGVVYDENYSIIPILNMPDIIRRLKGLLAYDITKYQSKNRKKARTVLIVDDSATTRQIEQTIFETSGFNVEMAVDGIEALELMKSKNIDAIITDIKMPRMDGMVFLSNIRRMPKYEKTPVIVVSGVYDPEIKEKFIQAGAQAFIIKSEFQRGNLLQAAKELLGE